MHNTLRIAWKNLLRYQRRTTLTSLLITVGIVAVLLFISVSGSFKAMMIGQITDSMLGHIQVHKRGYVSSIDSLPLNMNMPPRMVEKVREALAQMDNIESTSERVKFGAMFSNFTETTNIRLNAVVPEDEAKTTLFTFPSAAALKTLSVPIIFTLEVPIGSSTESGTRGMAAK